MASFNSITILGNLGRKPTDLRVTPSGVQSTDFSVAVSRKGKNGEDQTTWYRVKVFGKNAENVVKYLDKGSQVLVTGRHSMDEYTDKDGNKRFSNDVIANDVTFVGSRAEAAGAGGRAPAPIIDDDIPF